MIQTLGNTFAVLAVAGAPAFSPAVAMADDSTSGAAKAGGIALDLLVGRTTLLMATVTGAAFYAISLPITLPSGAERDARDRFVMTPWNGLTSPLGGE